MGKKKRRKKTEHKFRNTPSKPHEPTAFELAYQKAEARTKENASIDKKPLTDTDLNLKDLPESTPLTSKEKNNDNSLSQKLKYISTAVRQKLTIKRKALPKAAPPAASKKPSIKLGLKSETDQDMVLDIAVSQCEDQRHSSPESKKIESLSSRFQVHGENPEKESDIVIGFDFGTSSSKIVIRDSVLQTAYAIPFGFFACSENKYLVPTNIFIREDGYLSLSKGDHSYSNLKMNLVDEPKRNIFVAENISQTITASELAAAYMAQVICIARAWFLKQTESIYKNTRIQWRINLGIPSKNYNDKEMKKTFQSIAMAAWRISRLDSEITITEVKKHLKEAENHTATKGKDIDPKERGSLWLHPDFVNTHPEVIMEMVGYARSPLRTSGLHLIIDIGATTLDAATFIIHDSEGEDLFPILDTAVEKLGTIMLHGKRVETLKNSLEKSLNNVKNINPTHPLPDHVYYGIKLCEEEILECDDSFLNECKEIIGKVIKNTKHQRDPNSNVWQTELQVFVCGGGGRLSLYREAIDELGQNCSRAWNHFRGFAIRDIPQPDQLEAPDLSHEEYDRLAVAYGLSFTSDEIGEVIPESMVSNINTLKPVLDVEGLYISKDQC